MSLLAFLQVTWLVLLFLSFYSTYDIPPPSDATAMHGTDLLFILKCLSHPPPPQFMRGEVETERREGAAEHCSADKWMHHWWLSQQPTPSLAGPLPAPTVSEEEQHACSQHTHIQSICLLPDRRRTERFAFGVSLSKLQKCILVCRSWKCPSSTWFLH